MRLQINQDVSLSKSQINQTQRAMLVNQFLDRMALNQTLQNQIIR